MFDGTLADVVAIQVLGLNARYCEVEDEYVEALTSKAMLPVLEEKKRILERRIEFLENIPESFRNEQSLIPSWAREDTA